MRRPRGMGSVYLKDSNKDGKRKNKDKTLVRRRNPYVAVVTVGYDEKTGRRIRKTIGSFPDAPAAFKALDEYNGNPDFGKNKLDKVTFKEVWEAVLAARTRRGIKTYPYMHSYFRLHLAPLHNMPIADVKVFHLQRCIDAAPLAASTVRLLASMCNFIYEYAVANDLVEKDCSQFIVLPTTQKDNRERVFNTSELRTLWKNSDNPLIKMILILVYTGMRQNELSKMKTADVHLKERYMVGGSKTAAGKNREVPIAECIVPFIEHFMTVARFAKSDLLLTPKMDGFRNLHGRVSVAGTFSKTMDMLDMNHTSHDARHTFVTLATNWNVQDWLVKRIVGHTNTNDVTKDVYTHSTVGQYIEAVNTLPYGETMTLHPNEKKESLGAYREPQSK